MQHIHFDPMSEKAVVIFTTSTQDRVNKKKKTMEELWKRLNRETNQMEDVLKSSGESLAIDGRAFQGQFDELETILDKLEERVNEEEKEFDADKRQLDKILTDILRIDNLGRRMESRGKNDWQNIQMTVEYNTRWADEMTKWIDLEGWRLSRGLRCRGMKPNLAVTTVLWEVRMSLHSLRGLLQLKEGGRFGEKLLETEKMIERMVPKLRELLPMEKKPMSVVKPDERQYTAISVDAISDRPASSFLSSACSSRTSFSPISFPECELLEGFQTRKHQSEQGKMSG